MRAKCIYCGHIMMTTNIWITCKKCKRLQVVEGDRSNKVETTENSDGNS